MGEIRILTAGEQGLVVEFGTGIDEAINTRVHQLTKVLRESSTSGLREIVPTYRSLLVYFDPLVIERERLIGLIQETNKYLGESAETAGDKRIIKIPVCYGGEFGPDIDYVASHNGLSVEEVIDIHTSVPYLVYMLGFTPGFPYLGGMSDKIATPRLEKPRTVIPPGSVGIAGKQTGFYPIASPGGWQLIGRTPIKAFDSRKTNPFLFGAGDYLKFYNISPEEYGTISEQAEKGTYEPEIITETGREKL